MTAIRSQSSNQSVRGFILTWTEADQVWCSSVLLFCGCEFQLKVQHELFSAGQSVCCGRPVTQLVM